ncbi:hypothetical protein [Micromonospora sp. NPDC005220]|uniref:hypothetical protein n=1 Tax=Micromonospora sp. NPDC005220 TaxID=3155589 RepID=UPI0033B26137
MPIEKLKPAGAGRRQVRSGDLLHLTRAASPQFVHPITVRVIRALSERHTYDCWLWIDAYQLGRNGDAVARRELYLMPAGAQWLTAVQTPVRRTPSGVGR